MVIIQVAGGLGNQLQQYALYRKFVCLGKEARLDISWFEGLGNADKNKADIVTKRELELNYFDKLIFETCTREEKEKLIGTEKIAGKLRRKIFPFTVHWFKENAIYHPEIYTLDNVYISGYFACEKYYADIMCVLREEIQFPKGASPLNALIASKMKSSESVSIHVRRGDYLEPGNRQMFGGICTEKYYKKAVEVMKTNCSSPHFYLFSDDISYIKEQFTGEEYTVVDINRGRDSFYDIWLMSQCKHNICANSTFSFWGARLNDNADKIMIRPTIQKNSQVFDKEKMEDLWKGWHFINPDGSLM